MANETTYQRILGKTIPDADNKEQVLKALCYVASQMYMLTNHLSYDEIYEMFDDVIYQKDPSEESIYRLQRFADKTIDLIQTFNNIAYNRTETKENN